MSMHNFRGTRITLDMVVVFGVLLFSRQVR